jgi:hypothetical protein
MHGGGVVGCGQPIGQAGAAVVAGEQLGHGCGTKQAKP